MRLLFASRTAFAVFALVNVLGCGASLWAQERVPISSAAARIALGRELFFERALSIDGSTSCGTCHQPSRAYTQGDRLAVGLKGNQTQPEGFVGTRNVPTCLQAFRKGRQFADGRAASLTDQALQPWTNPQEMALPSVLFGLQRLAQVKDADGGLKYRRLFQLAYGEQTIRGSTAADALAMFQGTLVVDDAPVQRYMRGDEGALTERQRRGLKVFVSSGCTHCHNGPDLRLEQFANNGMARWGRRDIGRQRITNDPADARKFAIPTLIHVGDTAPYAQDGHLDTLWQVVAHYSAGGARNIGGQWVRDGNIDPRVRVLNLSHEQQADLVWFLDSATRGTFPFVPDPVETPKMAVGR